MSLADKSLQKTAKSAGPRAGTKHKHSPPRKLRTRTEKAGAQDFGHRNRGSGGPLPRTLR
jgi:hypothetical protein